MFKQTHKALTALNVVANGTMLVGNFILPYFGLFDKAAESVVKCRDHYLRQDVKAALNKLHFDSLFNTNADSSNVQLAFEFGAFGLAEAYLSELIFGQQTHFGLVLPGLRLAYGEDWNKNGEVIMAVGAVTAYEVAYYLTHKPECDHAKIDPLYHS